MGSSFALTPVHPLPDLSVLDQFKATPPSPGLSPFERRFYSPIDNVHDAIKFVLNAGQHSTIILLYGYDDDDFQAVLETKLTDPNYFVQMTLDSSQAGGVHERTLLEAWRHDEPGNSVAIGRSSGGGILHDKVAIVDGLYVISGSTNWSTSGETTQANECSIVQDPLVAAELRAIIDVQHDAVLEQMIAKAAT